MTRIRQPIEALHTVTRAPRPYTPDDPATQPGRLHMLSQPDDPGPRHDQDPETLPGKYSTLKVDMFVVAMGLAIVVAIGAWAYGTFGG